MEDASASDLDRSNEENKSGKKIQKQLKKRTNENANPSVADSSSVGGIDSNELGNQDAPNGHPEKRPRKIKFCELPSGNNTNIPVQGILVPKGTFNTKTIEDCCETSGKLMTSQPAQPKAPLNVTDRILANLKYTNNDKADTDHTQVYYPANYEGEISVLFDTSASGSFENKRIKNGLFLWEKIRKYNIRGITEVKAIGKSLYKVFFNTTREANDSLLNTNLKMNNIKPFIPKNFLETCGVVRQVPLQFTEQEILSNITSDVKVSRVVRITRRDPANKDKYLPTYTIKLFFQGNKIPETVKIFCVNFKTQHYIPMVRQCYNCGRLGHTTMACKSKKRCLKCGSEECEANDCQTVKCILCGNTQHTSQNKDLCPKWAREKEVLQIMTIKKISKSEAYNTYPQLNSQNRFELLNEYDTNFPILNTPKQ